jgi:hypothetical protein
MSPFVSIPQAFTSLQTAQQAQQHPITSHMHNTMLSELSYIPQPQANNNSHPSEEAKHDPTSFELSAAAPGPPWDFAFMQRTRLLQPHFVQTMIQVPPFANAPQAIMMDNLQAAAQQQPSGLVIPAPSIEESSTPTITPTATWLGIQQALTSFPSVAAAAGVPLIFPPQFWAANQAILAHQASLAGQMNTPQPLLAPPPPTMQPQSPPSTGRQQPIQMYLPQDEQSLSVYQCMVRKQIEVFQAQLDDVSTTAQGRVRPVVLGQVGLRCRHCALLPFKERRKGAVYYPTRLDGIYQAAQHISKAHLTETCQHVPHDIRQELVRLCDNSRSSIGGGKKYWSNSIQMLGVFEDTAASLLRFSDNNNYCNPDIFP